jgi:uncharacterized membrane protein
MMFASYAQSAPAIMSAFFASLVECIEALTIVLAVGAVRGWRASLSGAAAAFLLLLGLVALAGPALTRLPLPPIRLAVGALGLLFGLRWLLKAVRRAAGVLPLRDEARAYARETARLAADGPVLSAWDREAIATSFRVTALEGIEVVFIVMAIGATGPHLLVPASLGALAAVCVVVLLGLALHRPIQAIPENTLKFAVGVMLCAFGTFWLGEGVGIAWPGGDVSLLGLVAVYLAGALAGVGVLQRSWGRCAIPPRPPVDY